MINKLYDFYFLDIIIEYILSSDHYVELVDLYHWIYNHEKCSVLFSTLRQNLHFILYVITQHNRNY